MLYQIIYTSESNNIMTNEELQEILIRSRINNSRTNITGSLIYVDGVFLQILEGERVDVEAIADKIRRDGRHSRFNVLYEAAIPVRLFGAWQMACIRPSAREMAEWANLEGSSKVIDILAVLDNNPNKIPAFVASAVKQTATLPWF